MIQQEHIQNSQVLREVPNRNPARRLGRHVLHDVRSWRYPAAMSHTIVSSRHKRNVPIFNQGNIGSCGTNAGLGMVNTQPYRWSTGNEALAIQLYQVATRVDGIEGQYPPDDTGTTALAVMYALKKARFISSYAHAFGLQHVLRSLVLRPGITGFAWRESCDYPDGNGVVRYSGSVLGGHEVELVGLDAIDNLVLFANSWGEDWGDHGYFAMSFDDYNTALQDNGDATFANWP